MKSTLAPGSRTGSTMLEKSNDPLAVSVRRGVKTKYERGETMIGEKFLGDSRRDMVYPPHPDPRMTTRSFW